jgi:predicted membrane channel-forming protein YqfA (hemolysin III family)
MELIKALWILIFFLFSLTLIFLWSKIYVLFKRIEALRALLKKAIDLDKEFLKLSRAEEKK